MKYISPEGLEKLKQELEERKTVKRQEIAQRLEEAKALGDLAENTEYSAAKEAQAFNEGRIMELEEIIRESSPIKPTKGKEGEEKTVGIGSQIKVEMVDGAGRGDNPKQDFIIVSFQEADPSQGKISDESPLGRAFLGHQIGDIIEVETPRGKVKYKIVNID